MMAAAVLLLHRQEDEMIASSFEFRCIGEKNVWLMLRVEITAICVLAALVPHNPVRYVPSPTAMQSWLLKCVLPGTLCLLPRRTVWSRYACS